MIETAACPVGVFIVVVVLSLIYVMDRRMKTAGPLFTKPGSTATRLLAFLFGLVFGALSLWLTFGMPYPCFVFEGLLFGLLALALFAYALGAGDFLTNIQKGETKPFPLALLQPIVRPQKRRSRRKA